MVIIALLKAWFETPLPNNCNGWITLNLFPHSRLSIKCYGSAWLLICKNMVWHSVPKLSSLILQSYFYHKCVYNRTSFCSNNSMIQEMVHNNLKNNLFYNIKCISTGCFFVTLQNFRVLCWWLRRNRATRSRIVVILDFFPEQFLVISNGIPIRI